jgi:hypothetical protein
MRGRAYAPGSKLPGSKPRRILYNGGARCIGNDSLTSSSWV